MYVLMAAHVLWDVLAVHLFVESLLCAFFLNPGMALLCFLGRTGLLNPCLACGL